MGVLAMLLVWDFWFALRGVWHGGTSIYDYELTAVAYEHLLAL